MGDSYPYDWIQTSSRQKNSIQPGAWGGHGDVMHANSASSSGTISNDLMEQRRAALRPRRFSREAQKSVSPSLTKKYAPIRPELPQKRHSQHNQGLPSNAFPR